MTNQDSGIRLPKNIRQIGTFGEKYQIYIEDFVYTYVHRFLHQRKRGDAVLAAVLLGKIRTTGEREYVFISGAQKVDFDGTVQKGSGYGQEKDMQGVQGRSGDEQRGDRLQSVQGRSGDRQGGDRLQSVQDRSEDGQGGDRGVFGAGTPEAVAARQEEFWDRVYQRIKNSFDDLDILGWYFNLDGSGLEVHAQLQQFFESTYKKGSRFLYYEDALEKNDAFFVQEQHQLRRLSGYAVYYEKNPQMQQFMIEEKERLTPKPLRESYLREKSGDEAVQNYRAIMNRLNEKPPKRRLQPIVGVAGAAVLVIVAATAVTQIGNYQNLKVLQQTMQALSGAVNGEEAEDEDALSAEEEIAGVDTETGDEAAEESAEGAESAEEDSDASETGSGDSQESDNASDQSGSSDAAAGDASDDGDGASDSADTAQSSTADAASSSGASAAVTQNTSSAGGTSSYTVKEGDSLISISRSIYNTADMVDEICALNGIEDVDRIYVGQTLLLP